MKLTQKRVLVTGAGGFIGSHLAERLATEGCHVVAMIHYDSRSGRSNLDFVDPKVLGQIEVIAGDIRDPHFMVRAVAGCDIVFHLAALVGIPYSYVAPTSYVETNIQGTLNVLQACRDKEVERVIHTSTSECYGTAQYTPIDERHPLKGQSPYAATKIGADKLAESFYLSYGLPVTTIRPFNTFGPRQSGRAVVPAILGQLLSGSRELRLGALSPVRDLNYVTNTVDGFLALARSDRTKGKVFNIGSGNGVSISDVVRLALKVVGRRVPVRRDMSRIRPRLSEVRALIADTAAARRLTGWHPRISLEEGLHKTAQFLKANPCFLRSGEYAV